MTGFILRNSRGARVALLGAALAASIGIGCTEETIVIDASLTPLEARQALLEDAAAGLYSFANPPPTSSDDCTTTLSPGSDPSGDAVMLNTAVDGASTWDVICLEPGTYVMGQPVGNTAGTVFVSAVANLTLKGIGAAPEDVVLDYINQSDERGIDVTTPGFWIENMWIKNTKGNGVEVKATNTAENPNVFRKLRVSWDAGSVTDNGAYSIYPTRSEYIIAEFNEVEGASDAGLYIGQVEHGIVRYNSVHANVAGLEVENSFDVLVHDNEVYDNTGGILSLQEPGLTRLSNDYVLIRDNTVTDNNRPNFARPGTTVSQVPVGTGLMAFAGVNIEFRDNAVQDNDTTGLLIVSNVALDLISGGTPSYPMGYDPYPSFVNQDGNVFSGNGTAPAALFVDAPPDGLGLTAPLTDVLWDGLTDAGVTDPRICLSSTDTPTYTILLANMGMDLACDLRPVVPTPFP